MSSVKVKCKIDGKENSVEVKADELNLEALRAKLLNDKLVKEDGFVFEFSGEAIKRGAEPEFSLSDGMSIDIKSASASSPAPVDRSTIPQPGKQDDKGSSKNPSAGKTPPAKGDSKGNDEPGSPIYKQPQATDFNQTYRDNEKEMLRRIGLPQGRDVDTTGKGVAIKELSKAIDPAIKAHLFPVALFRGTQNHLDYAVASVLLSKDINAEILFEANKAQSLAGTLAGGGSTVQALAFKEQWQSEAYAFGYTRISGETSQSITHEGVNVESKANGSYESNQQNSTQTNIQKMHYCVEYSVPRARVTFEKEDIHLSQKFISKVRTIVEGSSDKKSLALNKLFLSEGFAIPLIYTLGARLVSSGSKKYKGSVGENLKKMTAVLALAMQLEVQKEGSEGVSVARKGSYGTGEEFKNVLTEIQQTLGSNVMVLGGADQVGINQAKWLSSLDEPKNWKLIYYDNPIPIWYFFDESLRDRVIAIFRSSALKDEIKKELDAYDLLSRSYRELLGDASEVQKLINISKYDTYEWGAKDYPGSLDAYSEGYEHTYKEFLGFTAIPLPNTREKTITVEPTVKMKKGHIITWFKITRYWGDEAHFEIKSGGLMQSRLEVHFESAAGKGHSWKLEVRSVHADELSAPPAKPLFQKFFYDALEYEEIKQDKPGIARR